MKYGAGLLRDLTSKHIKLIRNEIAREHSTSRAQTALGLFSTVWEFADEHLDLDLDANPRRGISRIHKTRGSHEPWPESLIEAFDKAAPPRLRLAMKLALYTGQRRSDLIRMDWSRFDGKFIEVCQQKTDELLSIPCHKELRAALGTPGTGPIITNAYGKAYSTTGLSNAFHDVLIKIGGKGYSIHGLRKKASVALAEAGCSDREIMAITGHRSVAMVTLYTRRANQKRRAVAAIEKWENAGSGNPKNVRGLK
jgi:integrase